MPARPRLVHRDWFVAAAGFSAATCLRAVDRTGRWDERFDPEVVAALARGESFIGVFWHQRILGIPALWRRLARAADGVPTVTAIVSQHGDGELIARTLGKLGIGLIRGSTKRGGAQAARSARAVVARGGSLAVVVDGPRGPHGHVHGGAVFLAKVTGRPLVPVTYAVARGVQANSWDRLLIPLPFTRGAFHCGAPIAVADNADAATVERLRRELGESLHALNARADADFGVAR